MIKQSSSAFLFILLLLTFGSQSLPTQTISSVQTWQEGLDREQTPGLKTLDEGMVLIKYQYI